MSAENAKKAHVVKLVKQREALASKAEKTESQLKEVKAQLREMEEETIPKAMQDLGVSSLTIPGKEVDLIVSIQPDCRASIAEKNQAKAYEWFRKNGHGDLLKNEVKVSIGMGEDSQAAELIRSLTELDLPFERKTTIHAGTLGSFVREARKTNTRIPSKLLGVYDFINTKIKRKQKG